MTPILISPCLFIMAPRVTPARCMKGPASCHPCPLPLWNVYLPSLSLPLCPQPSAFWGPLDDTNASLPHINVMYCGSQEEPVCFSLSLKLSCSQACSWLPPFQRYSPSLSSSSLNVVKERERECDQVRVSVCVYTRKPSHQRCEHTDPVMLNRTAFKKADS